MTCDTLYKCRSPSPADKETIQRLIERRTKDPDPEIKAIRKNLANAQPDPKSPPKQNHYNNSHPTPSTTAAAPGRGSESANKMGLKSLGELRGQRNKNPRLVVPTIEELEAKMKSAKLPDPAHVHPRTPSKRLAYHVTIDSGPDLDHCTHTLATAKNSANSHGPP